MKTYQISISLVLLVLICVAPVFAHEHSHKWYFGVVGGSVAQVEPEAGEEPTVHLTPSSGLFVGDWGCLEFENLPTPALGSVRLQFISATEGINLYYKGALVLGQDGSLVGPGYFDMGWPAPGIHHAHLTPITTTWGEYIVSYKLVNAYTVDGTPLLDSPIYQVKMETVPEPSGLIALGGLIPAAIAISRRRK